MNCEEEILTHNYIMEYFKEDNIDIKNRFIATFMITLNFFFYIWVSYKQNY